MKRISFCIISAMLAFFTIFFVTGCATWQTNVVPAVSGELAEILSDGMERPYENFDEEHYMRAFGKCGVTVVTWNDIRRIGDNWDKVIAQLVTKLHKENIQVIFTLSLITSYHLGNEPEYLTESHVQDPWGNTFGDEYGLGKIHSMIHEKWRQVLLGDIETAIDTEVDGIMIDELAYGSLFYPDFNARTVELFRDYLNELYSEEELRKRIIRKINEVSTEGCLKECDIKYMDLSNFNYAEFVKYFFCCKEDVKEITLADWNNWGNKKLDLHIIPLFVDFKRFLRLQHRETAEWLIQNARKSALDKHNKNITVSSNLNDMHSPEGQLIVDLLDTVDLEWRFKEYGYFPGARASTSVKLAQAFGKGGWVLTDQDTRSDLFGYNRYNTGPQCTKDKSDLGKENTDTLYKIMIADAHAAGGTFVLEEGMHCITLDLDELGPYFKFPRNYPIPFQGLVPIKSKIGVLLLFESFLRDGWYDDEDYRGLASILMDSGYQFDVIFAAKDYFFWGWESECLASDKYPLKLEQLDKYPVIIIPELADLIDTHADILIDYVKRGGKLIVFSTDDWNGKKGIEALANCSIVNDDGQCVKREKVLEFIGYLNDAKGEPPGVDIENGRIIWYKSLLGTAYLANVSPISRTGLQNILISLNVQPEVNYTNANAKAVGAFAYNALRLQYIGISKQFRILWFKNKYKVIHFVNYDYNRTNDSIEPISDLNVTVDLGDMFKDANEVYVRVYRPGHDPEEKKVTVSEDQGKRKIQFGISIDIWTAVSVEK